MSVGEKVVGLYNSNKPPIIVCYMGLWQKVCDTKIILTINIVFTPPKINWEIFQLQDKSIAPKKKMNPIDSSNF